MKTLLILGLLTVGSALGYNILCVQKVPSKSHAHLLKGIVQPLLDAGHHVTYITSFPDAKPTANLTTVDISSTKKIVDDVINGDPTKAAGIASAKEFARQLTEGIMEVPAVTDVMVNQQFDAVVTEYFFSDLDAGFAAILKVPWIVLSGTILDTHLEYVSDAVRSVPAVPAPLSMLPVPMNTWQRMQNVFAYILNTIDDWRYFPIQESSYIKYFGPLASARGIPLPPLEEVYTNVSILLVNSHPSFAPVKSLPPNVIDIAGFHIDNTVPPLPKDLQDLLDSSTQGVVYFSMGSVVKSSQLDANIRKDLVKIFGRLSQTVLWKFEEKIDGLPKNVHVRPWMPQSSILAHPNVKLFITHGGLLSTLESLHYGVPLLAVPVFADQPYNAYRSVEAGHALKVPFSMDMGPELERALHEMMTNDRNDFSSERAIYESSFGPLASARGVPLPPFEETHRNVSILLANSHPSFVPTRSLPPNVVDIAGYHIDTSVPPLPKDLQDILDASTQGVIYFSMGSVVKSAQLVERTRRDLIQIFGEMKQTVLWKFEEKIEGLPKNIHVRSWMPQSSILAHPNVKLFITHGGLLSTLESLHYGVPLLAVPVFGDQPTNAHRSVVAGHALKVDFSPDMAPELKRALHEMMSNDSYYNKAKYISSLFRKRPTHPSELITHYIQVAIESKVVER